MPNTFVSSSTPSLCNFVHKNQTAAPPFDPGMLPIPRSPPRPAVTGRPSRLAGRPAGRLRWPRRRRRDPGARGALLGAQRCGAAAAAAEGGAWRAPGGGREAMEISGLAHAQGKAGER